MAAALRLHHVPVNAITSFRGAYGWLSNFYPSPIELPPWGGLLFTLRALTAEHGYAAHKAARTADIDFILRAPTPGEAKRRGQQIALRENWDSIKEGVMLHVLRAKFTQPYFRALLLDTGDRMIIEGNGWGDRYWGVCNGRGRNRLGVLIMQVRDEVAS